MLRSVTLAAWGTRAGQSPPFRAETPVGSGPPLRFRSLGAATSRVGLRRGEAFFVWPAGRARAPSGYLDQRRLWVGAGAKAGPGCGMDRDSLLEGT